MTAGLVRVACGLAEACLEPAARCSARAASRGRGCKGRVGKASTTGLCAARRGASLGADGGGSVDSKRGQILAEGGHTRQQLRDRATWWGGQLQARQADRLRLQRQKQQQHHTRGAHVACLPGTTCSYIVRSSVAWPLARNGWLAGRLDSEPVLHIYMPDSLLVQYLYHLEGGLET